MINNNPISIDEFRTNLSDFIGRVVYGKERIVIKKYNREAAVLVSMEDYKRIIDPRKRFTREEWTKMFDTMDTIRNRIRPQDQKKLEAEIDRAVREVRAEKKQK